MKKLFFLPFAAAAMMLSACSDEEPGVNGGGDVATGDGQFLAISIVSNGGTTSRADEDDNYTDKNGTEFEDGTTTENEVKSLRIYFFTSTGDALNIKTVTLDGKEKKVNYYDVPTDKIKTDPATSENHDNTVERILEAVVMIKPGERLPEQVVAVLNPNTTNAITGLGNESINLPTLRTKYGDYTSLANKGSFVMTNSTYIEGVTIMDATPVSASNYATTEVDALNNPVEIYVERNVAKVRFSANGLPVNDKQIKDNTLMCRVYRKGANGAADEVYKLVNGTDTKNSVEVYVKFHGWDVTGDLNYANLIKKIQKWPNNQLGANVIWNRPTYHRCYWADLCNPTGVPVKNQYFSYKGTDNNGNAIHFVKNSFDGTEVIYCNENAERISSNVATSVIIKGTICDQNGKALPISEYGGTPFIDTEDLSVLKGRYITMFRGQRTDLPWRQTTKKNEDGTSTTEWVQLNAKDLTFISVETLNKIHPDFIKKSDDESVDKTTTSNEIASGRYYVYACLTPEAENYEWYTEIHQSETEPNTYEGTPLSKDELNKSLAHLSHAKVWNGGMTYYYADIQHLGENNYGTVRNHIYDINLTKIYGIGTPVYDETLVIIPEKPESDETYIAARVNILSWRVVSNNIVFEWD